MRQSSSPTPPLSSSPGLQDLTPRADIAVGCAAGPSTPLSASAPVVDARLSASFQRGTRTQVTADDALLEDPRRRSDELFESGSYTIPIGKLGVRLSNAVLRVLSSLVLAPLMTYFLWRSPAFATTTVCAVVVSVATYEYAWLAHRIHTRFVTTLEKYEEVMHRPSHGSSTQSLSSCGDRHVPEYHPMTMTMPTMISGDFDSALQFECVASDGQPCAISTVARMCFCGHEWLTALLISTIGTAVSSALFTVVASHGTFKELEFDGYRAHYSVITSFAGWLCACFAPDWKYAALLLAEKEIFTALTLYSMKCPINNFRCDGIVDPIVFLLVGILVILTFRLVTSSSALGFLLHLLLDALGFVYIIGSLYFIVNFVDIDRETTYRKLIIALLYVVWAADTGAYCIGQILETCRRCPPTHPLARHLSARKDYEGTAVAVVFGVCAMFISSHYLGIHGSFVEKLVFGAIAVVVGRIGDLFESLLKRAARVKDSGKLIPGHGGILDRIDALMFAALVFSRYFGAIVQNGHVGK